MLQSLPLLGILWWSRGQDSVLSLTGSWARYLVGELRSCKPRGEAKKKKIHCLYRTCHLVVPREKLYLEKLCLDCPPTTFSLFLSTITISSDVCVEVIPKTAPLTVTTRSIRQECFQLQVITCQCNSSFKKQVLFFSDISKSGGRWMLALVQWLSGPRAGVCAAPCLFPPSHQSGIGHPFVLKAEGCGRKSNAGCVCYLTATSIKNYQRLYYNLPGHFCLHVIVQNCGIWPPSCK